MRLPNFLSTVSNRASLSITQTLYDRRALDCTSSKPLVASLQQLMVLTSSSSRVREMLCQDGGLERLVQIMKEAHNPSDALAPFKWHLCMQCLLNLGARGSETVRMCILEAGAIPVIATVLDNYLVAHGDSLEHRDHGRASGRTRPPSSLGTLSMRAPSLDTAASADAPSEPSTQPQPGTQPQSGAQPQVVTQGEHSQDSQFQGLQPESQSQSQSQAQSQAQPPSQQLSQEAPSASEASDSDAGATQAEHFLTQFSQATGQAVRRSTFAEAPDPEFVDAAAATPGSITVSAQRRPVARSVEVDQGVMAQFVNGLLVPREQDVFWALEIIAFVSKYAHLRREMQETHFLPQLSQRPHEELFAGSPCQDIMMDEVASDAAPFDLLSDTAFDGFGAFSKSEASLDVLLDNMDQSDRAYYSYDFENHVDYDDEYLTRPVNLFELVERFTAFRSPREFPHWACIIMRNFVRKDESGIRQCANFACGKWEEYPRQFAKCRRCKRTKYCSKACQLKAWSMHRYWCAQSPSSSQSTTQTPQGQVSAQGQTITQAVQGQAQAPAPTPVQEASTGRIPGQIIAEQRMEGSVDPQQPGPAALSD